MYERAIDFCFEFYFVICSVIDMLEAFEIIIISVEN